MSKTPIIYNFLSEPLSQPLFESKLNPVVQDYKSLPAIITGIQDYEAYQCLDVKISIDEVYVTRNDYVQEGLELKKKFVSLPYSGGFSIQQPVAVGDPVKLCWANKSLGQYLDGSGGSVTVNTKEIAELEDCWVELKGGTHKNNTNPSTKNFIIEGPKTKFTITPEGDVTLVTEGSSSIKSSKHTIDTDVEITGKLDVKGQSYHHAGMFSTTYAGLAGTTAPASFEVNVNVDGTFSINGTPVNGHDHDNNVPAFPS